VQNSVCHLDLGEGARTSSLIMRSHEVRRARGVSGVMSGNWHTSFTLDGERTRFSRRFFTISPAFEAECRRFDSCRAYQIPGGFCGRSSGEKRHEDPTVGPVRFGDCRTRGADTSSSTTNGEDEDLRRSKGDVYDELHADASSNPASYAKDVVCRTRTASASRACRQTPPRSANSRSSCPNRDHRHACRARGVGTLSRSGADGA